MREEALQRLTVKLLTFGDTVLALFFFFPMTCLYWRGAWDLIGYYVLRDHPPYNYWLHSGIGCLTLFNYFLGPVLDSWLKTTSWLFFPVSRLFLVYQGVLYMFLWRGVWLLADYYISREWEWALPCLAVALFLLISMRCLRTTMWPPFALSVDLTPDLLLAANRFQTEPVQKMKYMFDSTFTALIVNSICIFCWRSVWCLYDKLIFPNHELQSNLTCLISGGLSAIILLSSQKCLRSVSCHLQETGRDKLRLLFEDVMYIIIFISMSLIWRGTWNLNVKYLITDPFLGGWINHGAGMILLLVFQTYSLVGGMGCTVDGADDSGGAFFPIQYLSLIIEIKNAGNEEKKRSRCINDDAEGDEKHLGQKLLENNNSPHTNTSHLEEPIMVADISVAIESDTKRTPLKQNKDIDEVKRLSAPNDHDSNDPWVLQDGIEHPVKLPDPENHRSLPMGSRWPRMATEEI